MIEQLLLETFFGGLTGYVTNDVAIKGLFKKGGVVEKTRDEFIHEASALLEEQVLTQEVLRERLTLEVVEAAMDELLRQFFQREMPEVLRSKTLGEVAGYDELWKSIQTELSFLWQQASPVLADILLEHLALGQLLPASQQEIVADKMLSVLQAELAQGRYGEAFLKGWLERSGEQSGEALGLAELAQSAAGQAVHLLEDWLKELLASYDEAVLELLQTVLERLAVPELLEELEQSLRVRPLADFCPGGADKLAQTITEALAGSSGELLWSKMASRLLQLVAGMEQPLGELAGKEAKALIIPFVRQQLPEVLTQIIGWLRQNETALNQLIEEAIDETIMQAGEFKSMALLMVRDGLLQELFSEHVIMDKVDNFLKEQMSAEELAEELTDKLLAYGGRLSPAQLLALAGGPQGPLHKIVRGFLRDNGLKYGRSRLPEQLNRLLDQPLGRWLPEGLAQRYGQSVEKQAARYLAEGLKGEAFQQAAAQAIRRLAEDFCHQPLRESLAGFDYGKDRWAAKGQQIMEMCIQRLNLPIERWVQQLDNAQTFEKWLAQAERVLPRLADKLSGHWRQKPLDLLYDSVFTKQWIEEILPVCRKFISDKLVEAAAGNLSQLAENSLNSLSNEEILRLVEDFMGRELKPLNYLGAALGALVGVVTGAVVAGPVGALAAGQTASMAAVAVGRSAVYGAVGYGTNCAAIKGLFWPYKPVAGVRALQGVVPKQQERFANSLGQMVNRYVLNEDILQEILVGQHERWQAMGTALAASPVVAADVLGQITQQREKIQRGSYKGFLRKSRQYLPRGLDAVSTRPLKETLPLEHLALSVDVEQLSQWLAGELAIFCRSEQKLNQWVNAGALMAPVGTFIKEQVPKLWSADFEQLKGHYAAWLDRPLAEALPKAWPSAAKEWLSHQVAGLGEQEVLVNDLTELVNGFLSEQTLGEAFEGKLSAWVTDNITSVLQSVLNEIIGWLAAKKEAITQLVQEQIRGQLNFMQLMGYAAVNGDELVGQIVERLVTIKLPIFLAVRQQEIGQAIENYWLKQLSPLAPAELALSVTPEAMAAFLDRLGEAPVLHQEMEGFLADAWVLLGQVPLAQWLAPTVFADRQTLTKALAQETALVQNWLDARWRQEQEELLFQAARILEPFIQKQLDRMTVGELLGPCVLALERLDWEKLLALGDFEPLAKTALSGVMMRVAEEPLEYWLDWPVFEAALTEQLEGILTSVDFQDWWWQISAELLEDAPRLWEEVLPGPLKEQLTGWVVQAFLASLRQEGSAVLREMNLAQVTSVQVQAMDAQQLERLVHGFAQPYFKHIQNMGWLGAGFAIPGILLSYWLL